MRMLLVSERESHYSSKSVLLNGMTRQLHGSLRVKDSKLETEMPQLISVQGQTGRRWDD